MQENIDAIENKLVVYFMVEIGSTFPSWEVLQYLIQWMISTHEMFIHKWSFIKKHTRAYMKKEIHFETSRCWFLAMSKKTIDFILWVYATNQSWFDHKKLYSKTHLTPWKWKWWSIEIWYQIQILRIY